MAKPRKDPRRRTLWLDEQRMFQLQVPGLPSNVSIAMNVDSPTLGKTRMKVVLEVDGEVPLLSLRRIGVAIANASGLRLSEVATQTALNRLGVMDTPFTVPAPPGKPQGHQAYATWVRLAEDGDVNLGMWLSYDVKDQVRKMWDKLFDERQVGGNYARCNWWPEKKMWWFGNRELYPEFMGRLLFNGFNVKWVSRPDFPPPPAVQKLEVVQMEVPTP